MRSDPLPLPAGDSPENAPALLATEGDAKAPPLPAPPVGVAAGVAGMPPAAPGTTAAASGAPAGRFAMTA
jgi:hypothetical protein